MIDKVKAAVEERKKKSLQQMEADNEAKKSKVESAFNARASLLASDVDESYINTFINDSRSFFAQSKTDWGNMSWQSATNQEKTKERERIAADLNQRKRAVQAYLTLNKGRLSEDVFNELTSYLDGADYNGVVAQFSGRSKQYSQYDSAEAYEKAMEQYKQDQALLYLNLDAYQRQIDDLRAEKNRYMMENKTNTNEKFHRVAVYDQSIASMEAYLLRARRLQEKEQLEGVGNANSKYYDPEFSTYAKQGASVANPTMSDAEGWLIVGKNHIGGADVGNIVTYSRDNWENIAMSEAQGGHTVGSSLYHWMTDKEVSVYNYHLIKNGEEKAQQYLDSIEETLNARKAGQMFTQFEDKTALELLFGVSAGLEQFSSGMRNLFNTEDDYIPVSSTQILSGMIREDLKDTDLKWYNFKTGEWEDQKIFGSSLGQGLYDFTTTTANMAPSILASTVVGMINPSAGAVTGNALLGMSSAGNAYQEKLNLGYSKEEARTYGTLVGLSEATLQYLIGGIGKLGKNTLTNTVIKNLDAVDNVLARFAKSGAGKFLLNGASEAIEEGLQSIIEPYLWQAVSGEEMSVDWQETMYSALMGFATGGLFEAGETAAGNVAANSKYRKDGRAILGANGGIDAMMDLANEMSRGSNAQLQRDLAKQNTKVARVKESGKTGRAAAKQVGKLYNITKAAANSQNKADIIKSLVRSGMSSNEANSIAGALVAQASSQELSHDQQKALESVQEDVGAEYANGVKYDNAVEYAIQHIINNEQSTMSQRSQRMEGFANDIAVGTWVKAYTEKAFSPEGKYEVSSKGEATKLEIEEDAEGKTITKDTGETIEIKGVHEIRKVEVDGKTKIELILDIGDGKTINAENVAFANKNDALIYEAIANLGDNINAETANKLIAKYDGSDAMVFARAMAQAYTYGFYGLDRSELVGKHSLATELTEEQRNYAYGLGEQYRPTKDANDKADASKKMAKSGKAPSEKGVYYRDKDGNATDISTYLKESGIKLNDAQKTGIEAMRKLSAALGVRFNVFETWVENGKHFYLDENGDKVMGNPNGFYDTRTGEIYIDLRAGNNYEGTILFTVAHELTHFMRQWSPEHFTKIASIVFKHGGMKGNVSGLIALKQKKASEKGKPISYDTAMEEVVADGMETILKDGKAVEFMADVKKKDHVAWQKLKAWFKNLAKFLRQMVWAYRGHSAQTAEGAKIAEFSQNLLTQIERIFAEGAVASSENYQTSKENALDATAEKNTTGDGGEVMHMSRDIADVTENTVRMDLTDVFNGNNVSANSYIPISKTTPFALRYITRQMANLPMIVDKKKAYFDMRESGKFKEDGSHHYHGMGVDGFLHAIDILEDPEYAIFEQKSNGTIHYAFVSSNEKGEEVCVVFQMGVTKPANQMNGYPGGYYNLDITEFVATDEWLDEHGVEPGTSYKDYLLSFPENSIAYDRRFHLEQLEKARIIDSESAGVAASYDNNRASKDRVTQPGAIVKNESLDNTDVEIDTKTESAAPTVLKSERTWTESDYVQNREVAAKEIAKAIGVSVKKAKDYIDSVNGIAKMIAEDRVRLDYFSSPGRSSFVSNVEYGGSFDFSTLCKKRRLLTGTFTAIQKALPNTALTANEILDIRRRMKDAGLEVSCGLCYVEGSRANMGQFAKEFIKLYKQYYPDAWQPNMADVNTPDGIEWVRINHPECYEQYEYFWNHYGTLKSGDKNLFASQQKPKLYQLHTEYKGEILEKFNDDDNVEEKNLNGGIRLQSFSDFEIVHLIDTMQIIMDMSRVGLAGQAYTKVPDFAWALGDTGLKINLSLIAKGVDENGRLIFDDVEGMPIDTAVALRDRYSKNVGTILVSFNDEQLMAAMADDRVDFIIPFHRSQWKKSQYEAMGLPAKTKDYTYMQNEKFIKPQYHEYRGRMVKDKATNYMPNEYWDFSKSGKENAEAYLEMCARNNKRPKFYKLLTNNGDGSYSLKADGSTDGYWKLLIDFKMYDNDGAGSPQMPVKPDFNMDEATRMLEEYRGGHSNFPVARSVVDSFVKEYSRNLNEDMDAMADNLESGTMFSERDYPIDADMSMIVSNAINDINTGINTIGKISAVENRAVNKLAKAIGGDGRYIGKFTDGKHIVTSDAIKHMLEEHSNTIREALRAQLPITATDIARTFSAIKNGRARISGQPTRTRRGTPSILQTVEVNGYTLYAEEIMRPSQKGGTQDLMGHTLYKAPTLATAAGHATSAIPLPKRQSEVLYIKKNSTTKHGLSSASFVANSSGDAAELYFKEIDGRAVRDDLNGGLILLSSSESTLDGTGSDDADIKTGFVMMRNPYIITPDHRVFSDSEADVANELRKIRDAGYDGFIFDYQTGDNYAVMVFKDAQIVRDISDYQPLYSDRDTDSVSNRSLLANAFESVAQNDIERNKIQEYKSKVSLIDAEEKKLRELNEQIKELSFSKGPRDTKKINGLRIEANKAANRINTYDKQLLRLEASKPLQDVLTREKKKAYKKAEQEGKKALAKQREKAAETQRALLEKWQDSRKKAVENREKTAMRQKIRKIIRDLDKILNRGNKKQNVKEDMKGFVASAIASAEVLFTENYANEDMIRNGVGVVVSPEEQKYLDEARAILAKINDLPSGSYEAMRERQKTEGGLKNQFAYRMAKLKDVFTRERIRLSEAEVSSVLGNLADEYAKLKDSDQEYVKGAFSENVYSYIKFLQEDIGGAKIKDMSLSQLESLYKAYTMVMTTVRNANKAFMASKNVDQLVEKLVTEFGGRNMPKKKVGVIARNISNMTGWDYEKLYYALDRIGSDTLTELFTNLANSENIVMADVNEAKQEQLRIVEKYKYNTWKVDQKIDKDFVDNTGKTFRLTLGELMSLYAYSRREGAWNHIEYGGFVFGKSALTDVDPVTAYKLTKEQCEAITNTLTEEQKKFAEEMQTYLSDVMGAKGNEVSMLLYGIEMFGEKNYFPIHISGQFKANAQESQAKAEAGFSSMTNAGFTQAQNKKAKAPFVMESFMEVWVDHVNEMSRYHGTVLALEDIRKVMNYSYYSDSYQDSMAVKAIMENKFGKQAVDYFNNLYQEANSGAVTDKLQKNSHKLLSLSRKGSVAYSLSVLVQQPASMVRAYAFVPKKYFRGLRGHGALPIGIAQAATSKWTKSYKATYAKMLKYAPGVTLAKEIGGFDTASGHSIRSYLLDTEKGFGQKWKTETALGKAKAVYDLVDDNPVANLPNVSDKIAWIEIWNACENETKAKRKDLTNNSEAFYEYVGNRFTEVIRATQVYDSIFAKSPMLKSKNLAVQYLVSFMNEPNTVANMVESAARDFTRGDIKSGFRKATAVVRAIVFTSVLKSIIYAMRDDDEDETYIEKYTAALVNSLISDITVFNYIPGARDVWSLAQGYDVERPDMAIVSDAIASFIDVVENRGKDTSDMTEEELEEWDKKVTEANWKLADSVCALFGIPMKNTRREINAIMDTARIAHENSGKTSWLGIQNAVNQAIADASPSFAKPETQNESDKLYDAIISGDTTYVSRLKSGYKDDKAYHSAVRKALRGNDLRIKKAAQAQINRDPSERVRIAKLIIADGFDQDDVVAAINAEINATTSYEGGSSTKEKGFYTTEDFALEIANGDQASAYAAREDFIATDQKNGKSKENAEKSFASSAKSEMKKLYLSGDLSERKAVNALVSYCDMDETEAELLVESYGWEKRGYEGATPAAVRDYNNFCAVASVPKDVYLHIRSFSNNTENDKDANGKSINYSAMKKVIAEIDAQRGLSSAQKTAIARSLGWSDKNINKYKTW